MTLPPGSPPIPHEPTPTQPSEYHRLARLRPRYRWWRGLLTGLLGSALYTVVLLMILIPLAVLAVFDPAVARMAEELTSTTEYFDPERPWLFLALVLPLILMIPALLLASRIVEGRGVGYLLSVAGRMRWGWLLRSLGLAFAVFAVYFALVLGVSALSGETIEPSSGGAGVSLMILLVLLLIPLQAAAEEYVFRGYLMQLIGGWLRHPAFAILLPAPLFVAGHGYDIWGGLSVGAFAVAAGWLAWRTGGLEAAISVHIVNNVGIFVLGAFGLMDANATTGTAADLIMTVIVLAVYAFLADRWARRLGVARTAVRVPESGPVAIPDQAASRASASRIV